MAESFEINNEEDTVNDYYYDLSNMLYLFNCCQSFHQFSLFAISLDILHKKYIYIYFYICVSSMLTLKECNSV